MPSLYVSRRPKTWDDVIGQDAVVATIRALLDKKPEDTPKAWLLSGPAGTGKTTLSRLIAADLGANSALSIREMNGADKNGVDDIRTIITESRMLIHGSKANVYIIDEAHMLTKQAQNAFLKVLEEPPKATTFILTTTNPDSLLPTITSRCKQFYLPPLTSAKMKILAKSAVSEEGLKVSDANIDLAIRSAGGSPRLLLNMLESADAAGTDASASDTIIQQQSANSLGNEEIAAYLLYEFVNAKHKTQESMWLAVAEILREDVYARRLDLDSVKYGVEQSFGRKLLSFSSKDTILTEYNRLSEAARLLTESHKQPGQYGNGSMSILFFRMVRVMF